MMTDGEKIIETIAKAVKADPATINDETKMKEDLNFKSSNYFSVIAVLEEMTNKKVTYAQLRKYKTVGDIKKFVEELKAQ